MLYSIVFSNISIGKKIVGRLNELTKEVELTKGIEGHVS